VYPYSSGYPDYYGLNNDDMDYSLPLDDQEQYRDFLIQKVEPMLITAKNRKQRIQDAQKVFDDYMYKAEGNYYDAIIALDKDIDLLYGYSDLVEGVSRSQFKRVNYTIIIFEHALTDMENSPDRELNGGINPDYDWQTQVEEYRSTLQAPIKVTEEAT